MRINKIILNDFRQYYGKVDIDLRTFAGKNIVLIGGKNGYGKTNFLMSIVWCLYGEKISQIDESFKREVQKESNYQKFLKQSLNNSSKAESNTEFSVEIHFCETSYSNKNVSYDSEIIVRREFNTADIEEKLSILDSKNKPLYSDFDDMNSFINDYLIPLEAAKFVFFDAEKIADWAELSTKDEGNVLNDALGKLLGLDLYENLKDDLNSYCNNLKKEGATSNIKEQLLNTENAIEINKGKIEEIELTSALNVSKTKGLKDKIKESQNYINIHSKQEDTSLNREVILKEIEVLEIKKAELESLFNEKIELIPLAILSGKIEEVIDHLNIQELSESNVENNQVLKRKMESFIEKLFNNPPEPVDGTMSFKNKIYYSEKAHGLLNEIFEVKDVDNNLDFEIDLSKSDKELIFNAFQVLQKQSRELYENTINGFNELMISIEQKKNKIRKIDSNLEDETVLETITLKEAAERKLEKILEENGAFSNQKEKLIKDNIRLNQRYTILLEKSTGNKIVKRKIATSKKYIDSLQIFINNQKQTKKDTLASNILEELKKLMHKIQNNSSDFITGTRVDILPDEKGLRVSILNSDGEEMPKEMFSTGEKQLYISCLVKALLKESIQNFPIFIDTPLGRLDHEHIENILKNYYPDLSNQVVLLSTNNEVTPSRFNLISDKISHTYLIENRSNKSLFKPGYFKSYEN
jgi:DNA sulfur modification protein DndD